MTKFILHRYRGRADSRNAIGRISGVVGIISNFFIALIKLLAGTLSHSVSIIADALNNLTDAASSIITLIGFKLASQPADKEHPYGHARFEYLSALTVSALIVIIGFELGKSSVERIISPVKTELTIITFIILLVSIVVKLWLYHFNNVLGKEIKSSALTATATDCRNDVIATSAVLLSTLTEYLTDLKLDAYIGLLVAIFILYSGAKLAKETISPLLGEGADPEMKELIVDYISSSPKVLGFHDLMVHDYGVGCRFASLHVEMDKDEDPLVCHEIIDDMERECLNSHGINLVIHYDPVITDDPMIDKMRHFVLSLLKMRDERISIHDFRMVPGESHTNLIFDICLPSELFGKEEEIKRALDHALNDLDTTTYYTVITFDREEFN